MLDRWYLMLPPYINFLDLIVGTLGIFPRCIIVRWIYPMSTDPAIPMRSTCHSLLSLVVVGRYTIDIFLDTHSNLWVDRWGFQCSRFVLVDLRLRITSPTLPCLPNLPIDFFISSCTHRDTIEGRVFFFLLLCWYPSLLRVWTPAPSLSTLGINMEKVSIATTRWTTTLGDVGKCIHTTNWWINTQAMWVILRFLLLLWFLNIIFLFV